MIYDTIAWIVTQTQKGEAYKLCKSLERFFLIKEEAEKALEEMGDLKQFFSVQMVIVRSATEEEVADYHDHYETPTKNVCCNGTNCGEIVCPDDPYYATPCGSFCNECMLEHARECGVCRSEFGLNGACKRER